MNQNLFDLNGKTALVTGATRGIGFAMAVALAQAGANIIGASKSLSSEGSEIQTAVEKCGKSFIGYSVDFSDRVSTASFVNKIADKEIDILVNNAGNIERAPAIDHSLDAWDRIIEINLSSQFMLTQVVAKNMIQKGAGKIIFTASLLSFQGGINVPGYTASKSAIAGLTKALSNEWASKGINVNAIAPGYIATDNTQALRNDEARFKSIVDRIPAGRWGNAEDLAGATVFLASKASDYVSGITLPVDGGWLGR
jgi:2-dehydro-3-deoxy-D-gluconate 5-dehydrogenase